MAKQLDNAHQKAVEALQDAYGRTQKTPDGLMCRMGRIDRAYQRMSTANGNKAKYEVAIKAMRDDAAAAFALADKLQATYARLCKIENIAADIDLPNCDCSYCWGEFTGSMNDEDWQRFIAFVGATDSVDRQTGRNAKSTAVNNRLGKAVAVHS